MQSTVQSTGPLQLYLASASPRRREILATLGVRFKRIEASIDETVRADESALAYVERLARGKAQAGLVRAVALEHDRAPVLGADTSVVIDGEILGKPIDQAHSAQMLRALSGRRHEVYSAVAITDSERSECRVNISEVWFSPLSEDMIDAYWHTGEPVDKAGSYGIQALGATFVERINGSHSGVMGLPIFETAALLRTFDIDIWRPQ